MGKVIALRDNDELFISQFLAWARDNYNMQAREAILMLISSSTYFKDDKENTLKKIKNELKQYLIEKEQKKEARKIFSISNFERRLIIMLSKQTIDINEISLHLRLHKKLLEIDNLKNKKNWKIIFKFTKNDLLDLRENIIQLVKTGYNYNYLCAMGIYEIKSIYNIDKDKYKFLEDKNEISRAK